jgi:D-tyrosyl-tRNA(Tyr) deacylase
MRCVLQKVTQATVVIDQKTVGAIAHGFVLLLGVTHADTQKDAEYLVEKILKLRLFSDPGSDTFMEKNIVEVDGSVLVVSQFTLYSDCRKGTRPSFTDAAKPDVAKPLYEYFVRLLREKDIKTETGEFGEHMEVSLTNDGPVTLVLESK